MPARTSPGKTRSAFSAGRPEQSRKIGYLSIGSRPLLGNQGRIEKLATGKSTSMKATEKLKIAKNTLTVGTWNVQTLDNWKTGKLELLRNEMKRFRYDIV